MDIYVPNRSHLSLDEKTIAPLGAKIEKRCVAKPNPVVILPNARWKLLAALPSIDDDPVKSFGPCPFRGVKARQPNLLKPFAHHPKPPCPGGDKRRRRSRHQPCRRANVFLRPKNV